MKKRTITGIIALASAVSTVGLIPTTSYAKNAYPYMAHENAYEYIDYEGTCYFSDPDGNVFEFNKIYSIEEGYDFYREIHKTNFAKGVVCRPYKGEKKPFYVMDCSQNLSTINNEGSFEYEGQEYSYSLIPPAKMVGSYSDLLMKLIIHLEPWDSNYIACLDYNKDGKLMIQDAILYNQKFMATPFIHVTNLEGYKMLHKSMSQEDFFKILDYKFKNGEEEIYIRFGDEVPTDVEAPTGAEVQADSTVSNETQTKPVVAKNVTETSPITDEVKVEFIPVNEDNSVDTVNDIPEASTEIGCSSLNAVSNAAVVLKSVCAEMLQ